MIIKRSFFAFLAILIVLQGGIFSVFAKGTQQGETIAEFCFDVGSNETKDIWKAFGVYDAYVGRAYDALEDADGNTESGSAKFTLKADNSFYNNQMYLCDGNGTSIQYEKEKTYIISFDIKSSANGNILHVFNNVGKESRTIGAEWQKCEFTFTPSVNGYANFDFGGSAGQNYWIDNAKVEKLRDLPKLTESIPAHGSVVAPASVITLTFNNKMSDNVYNTENYLLNGEYAVREVISQGDYTYKLMLVNSMRGSSSYTLGVSNLKDDYGQSLDTFSISFETEQGQAPTIESIIPADDSFNFIVDDVMTVVFDTEIDFDCATTNEISVDGGAEINGILLDNNNKNVIKLKFSNLDYLTKYTVTFDGIRGISGEPMGRVTTSFTTQAQEIMAYYNKFDEEKDTQYPNFGTWNVLSGGLSENDYFSAPASGKFNFEQTSGQLIIAQESKLEADKYYTLSFYIKGANGAVDSCLQVISGDNKSYILGNVSATNDWVKYSKVFKASTTAMPFFSATKVCSVLIDNLKIAEVVETAVMEGASTLPKQCEKGVSIEPEFKLVFNNEIESCNVTIDGEEVTVSIADNVVTFSPGEILEYGMVYKMNIDVTDEYGRKINIKREFKTEKIFETDGIKIYTNYGNPSLKEDITNSSLTGGRLTAEISRIKNNSNVLAEANLILVLYKDKKMTDANFTRFSVDANSEKNDNMYIGIDVPEDITDGDYSISAFLWNSFDEIIPYLKRVEIKE